jgi:hypothetical protein
MHPENREALERRVVRSAEAALEDHGYVSANRELARGRVADRVNTILEAWRG